VSDTLSCDLEKAKAGPEMNQEIRRRSADIPVCGFTELSSFVFLELATGKSPEPAGWKVCATSRFIRAAPFPIFRTFAKTRVHGIHGCIMTTAMHVFIIANEVIKRFCLPKRLSDATEQPVGFARGETFPTLQNRAQCPREFWAQHRVDVIRYYGPRV
jgi:hypothetical protein